MSDSPFSPGSPLPRIPEGAYNVRYYPGGAVSWQNDPKTDLLYAQRRTNHLLEKLLERLEKQGSMCVIISQEQGKTVLEVGSSGDSK